MLDVITFTLELLFAFIFLRALLDYSHKRDQLSLDVVLVFSAMAILFFLDLLTRVQTAFGLAPLPLAITIVAIVLLLAQPLLTLRLAARLGYVPSRVILIAMAAFILTAGPFAGLVLAGQKALPPALTLGLIGVFVATEIAAARYLLINRRRRTGAGRARFTLIIVGTVAFAFSILGSGAGSLAPGTADVARVASLLVGLLAAIGYLLAFFPPARLRRAWQAGTVNRFDHFLRSLDPSTPASRMWTRFAVASAALTGSEGVVVFVADDDDPDELAAAWFDRAAEAAFAPDEPARLAVSALAGDHDADMRPGKDRHRLLTRHGDHFATVVTVATAGGRVAVVYLSRFQSLFSAEDRDALVAMTKAAGVAAHLLVAQPIDVPVTTPAAEDGS